MRIKHVVLSIGQDAEFRLVIEAALSQFGANTKSLSDPADFVDAAARLKPDLYLIDFNLGETVGLELIGAVREIDSGTPIIILSDVRDKQTITHALELGANDFVTRPLDRMLLATKLSRFINTEQIAAQLLESHKPPKGTTSGKIAVEAEILEIDELGIKLFSPHLFPKGTVLRVQSELFSEMELGADECLVVVTNTTVDPVRNRFSAYAEFDGVDPAFIQIVRRWLTRRWAETPIRE